MSQNEPKSELHRVVEQANDLAPATKERYLRELNRWVAFAGAEPKGWTRRASAAFYNALLKTMKPQSANSVMSAVAYASRWWAYLEHDPNLDFARVQMKQNEDEKPQRALDEATVTKLLETCHGRTTFDRRDLALFVVGLETGMRRMSLISMNIETTILDSSDSRWPYPATLVMLKGRTSREWVPLSDTAVRTLRAWLVELDQSMGVRSGPVFRAIRRAPLQRGRTLATSKAPLSRTAITHILDGRVREAGIEHIHPHQLRHTFVTWRTDMKQRLEEIAAVTHHDITKALGALGGYIDMREVGGKVRNSTPPWLAELVRRLI